MSPRVTRTYGSYDETFRIKVTIRCYVRIQSRYSTNIVCTRDEATMCPVMVVRLFPCHEREAQFSGRLRNEAEGQPARRRAGRQSKPRFIAIEKRITTRYREALRSLQCRSHVTITLNRAAMLFLLSSPICASHLLSTYLRASSSTRLWLYQQPVNTTPYARFRIQSVIPATARLCLKDEPRVCRLFVLPSCGSSVWCHDRSFVSIIRSVFLAGGLFPNGASV